MSTNPLPIILSIPHGGLAAPPEVADSLAINATTIYNECDLWAEQLYDFQHPDLVSFIPAGYSAGSLASVSMPIARVLIDANRDPADLNNPDGPVKTMTSYGQAVYRNGISSDLQRQLLDTYWQPYHQALETALQTHAGQVKLFLDCHNMAQHGPTAYDFPGAVRPFICLANFGDDNGEPTGQNKQTICSGKLLCEARALAETLFADLTLLEPVHGEEVPIVALNWPFAGGYIVQRYSRLTLPSIMIEINRGLFVGDQTTDTRIAAPNLARIAQIRQRLYQWAVYVSGLI